MDRVDLILTELCQRMVQFSLGTDTVAVDLKHANHLMRLTEVAMQRRKDGTLDEAALITWASAEVPWLRRALGIDPEPPRPQPPSPATVEERPRWVPPPSPAHAAVAARIISGDRPPTENR